MAAEPTIEVVTDEGPTDLSKKASTLLQKNLDKPKTICIKEHLYFYQKIDDDSAKELIATLHNLAAELITASLQYTETVLPSIKLHINSGGGSVSSALGIVKCIEDLQSGRFHKVGDIPIPVRVDTYIEGEADSAASVIACVGNKRYISKYATSVIHNPRQQSFSIETPNDIDERKANLDLCKKMLNSIYLAHSKLSEERLNEIMFHELSYAPEQLLEFGLVDVIE